MPAITNLDSPSTVVLKSNIVWVLAALNHGRPNPINVSSTHAMGRLLLNMFLMFVTPTRMSCPTSKAFTKDNPFLPAITSTKILNLVMPIILNPIQDRNATKPFSRQIYSFHSIHDTPLSIDCQGVI
jgi:hypothetical protein